MASHNYQVQTLRSYLNEIEQKPQTERDDILSRLKDSSCPVILSGTICLCQKCFAKEEHPIDSGLLVLEESSTALEQSINMFNKALPPEEEKKHRFGFFARSSKHAAKGGLHKIESTTTFQELRTEINSAIKHFNAPDAFAEKTIGQKIGYVWSCVCSKLDAFQALWSLIPDNSIYTSLFCGVAKMIVQATVEYDRICLDFATCMEEICGEISSIDRVAEHDLRTQSLACYLYAQFFIFYRAVLLWMTSNAAKKCLRSLTSSLHDELRSCVTDVRRLAVLIDRNANIAHNMIIIDMQRSLASSLDLVLRRLEHYSQRQHEDMVSIYVDLEDVKRNQTALKNIVTLLLMTMEDRERFLEQKHQEGLQGQFNNISGTDLHFRDASDTGSFIIEQQHIPLLLGNGGASSQSQGPDVLQDLGQKDLKDRDTHVLRGFSAEELRMSSSSLDCYIDQDTWKFLHTISEDSLPFIEQRLGHYFEDLLTVQRPCVLWVRTDFTEIYPSSVSAIAAGFVDTCLHLQFPVLAFFCNWPSVYKGRDKQQRAERCLQDLVSSVIRQLIDQLPSTIQTDFDLDRQRFLDLEKDFWGCWPYALELLRVLVDSVTSSLFVVLDGVDHLEWTCVEGRLQEVIAILVSATVARAASVGPTTGVGRKGDIKILLTTAGDCSTLAKLEANVPAGCFDSIELSGPRLR